MYQFPENPFADKAMPGDNNHTAMRFIQQTLITQKVLPVAQAVSPKVKKPAVGYGELFSPNAMQKDSHRKVDQVQPPKDQPCSRTVTQKDVPE